MQKSNESEKISYPYNLRSNFLLKKLIARPFPQPMSVIDSIFSLLISFTILYKKRYGHGIVSVVRDLFLLINLLPL